MDEFLNRLLELFEESVILQGFITVVFTGTYCYLIVTGHEVPNDLAKLVWAVLGFWFGSKSQAAMSSTIRRLGNGRTSPNSVHLDSHSDS